MGNMPKALKSFGEKAAEPVIPAAPIDTSELDALKKEVAERGLQPKSPTPEPRKRPVQPGHGMLNPTSGASGKTSKVGT